jgi:hypothetical protein
MIEYNIDRPDRLLRVRMSGSTTSADLARHYSRVLDDPAYDASFNIIFHIDDDAGGPILTEIPDAGLQMETLARLQHGTKWAVVMAPSFKRTVTEFLLMGVRLGSVQLRFFDDDEMAFAWLGRNQDTRVPKNA